MNQEEITRLKKLASALRALSTKGRKWEHESRERKEKQKDSGEYWAGAFYQEGFGYAEFSAYGNAARLLLSLVDKLDSVDKEKKEGNKWRHDHFLSTYATKTVSKAMGQKYGKLLKSKGICTIGDLVNLSREDLLSLGVSAYYANGLHKYLEERGAFDV